MKSDELAAVIRNLWEKSQVPLNRENLSEHTGLSDRHLERGLTALVKAGELGVESAAGEMRWTVPGAVRAMDGPESLERFERLERMRAEVKARVKAEARARRSGEPPPDDDDKPAKKKRKRAAAKDSDDDDDDGPGVLALTGLAAKTALSVVSKGAGKLDRKGTGGKKNLLLSAGLSFLGPLGWFYAGAFREAVPATLLFIIIGAILPNPILWPLLWFALPLSAATGLAYAWQYNRAGERRPLLLSAGDDDDKD